MLFRSQEARRLAALWSDEGDEADDAEGGESTTLIQCAERILAMGCEYVLVTGTHENTQQVINTLYNEDGLVSTESWPRLPGQYHGSGCTLASAIAATIANGLPMAEAVKDAQEYTWQTLRAGFRAGMGQHIPDRLFWAREEAQVAEDGANKDESKKSDESNTSNDRDSA